MTNGARFRMGRLDHVHIRVPDRAEAAAWYADHLGFAPVERFGFWASGIEGGPLQISADGGHTTLALFETSEAHPMMPQRTGVAFSVDASVFATFARSLPNGIGRPSGGPLMPNDIVDFDLCWAYDLIDPWSNQYELNCYEYDQVKANLIEAEGISPTRYWPPDQYVEYRKEQPQGEPPRPGASVEVPATRHNIRLANRADITALHALSLETGLSEGPDDGWVLTPQDDDHTWLVLESEGGVVIGGAYFGPESHSDRVWNLYFLAVGPHHQGGGTGSALVSYIETELRRRGDDVARVLLIETSGVPNFAPTRDFYRKHGYVQEARIREYYGPGDDKIVFWKSLA